MSETGPGPGEEERRQGEQPAGRDGWDPRRAAREAYDRLRQGAANGRERLGRGKQRAGQWADAHLSDEAIDNWAERRQQERRQEPPQGPPPFADPYSAREAWRQAHRGAHWVRDQVHPRRTTDDETIWVHPAETIPPPNPRAEQPSAEQIRQERGDQTEGQGPNIDLSDDEQAEWDRIFRERDGEAHRDVQFRYTSVGREGEPGGRQEVGGRGSERDFNRAAQEVMYRAGLQLAEERAEHHEEVGEEVEEALKSAALMLAEHQGGIVSLGGALSREDLVLADSVLRSRTGIGPRARRLNLSKFTHPRERNKGQPQRSRHRLFTDPFVEPWRQGRERVSLLVDASGRHFMESIWVMDADRAVQPHGSDRPGLSEQQLGQMVMVERYGYDPHNIEAEPELNSVDIVVVQDGAFSGRGWNRRQTPELMHWLGEIDRRMDQPRPHGHHGEHGEMDGRYDTGRTAADVVGYQAGPLADARARERAAQREAELPVRRAEQERRAGFRARQRAAEQRTRAERWPTASQQITASADEAAERERQLMQLEAAEQAELERRRGGPAPTGERLVVLPAATELQRRRFEQTQQAYAKTLVRIHEPRQMVKALGALADQLQHDGLASGAAEAERMGDGGLGLTAGVSNPETAQFIDEMSKKWQEAYDELRREQRATLGHTIDHAESEWERARKMSDPDNRLRARKKIAGKMVATGLIEPPGEGREGYAVDQRPEAIAAGSPIVAANEDQVEKLERAAFGLNHEIVGPQKEFPEFVARVSRTQKGFEVKPKSDLTAATVEPILAKLRNVRELEKMAREMQYRGSFVVTPEGWEPRPDRRERDQQFLRMLAEREDGIRNDTHAAFEQLVAAAQAGQPGFAVPAGELDEHSLGPILQQVQTMPQLQIVREEMHYRGSFEATPDALVVRPDNERDEQLWGMTMDAERRIRTELALKRGRAKLRAQARTEAAAENTLAQMVDSKLAEARELEDAGDRQHRLLQTAHLLMLHDAWRVGDDGRPVAIAGNESSRQRVEAWKYLWDMKDVEERKRAQREAEEAAKRAAAESAARREPTPDQIRDAFAGNLPGYSSALSPEQRQQYLTQMAAAMAQRGVWQLGGGGRPEPTPDDEQSAQRVKMWNSLWEAAEAEKAGGSGGSS